MGVDAKHKARQAGMKAGGENQQPRSQAMEIQPVISDLIICSINTSNSKKNKIRYCIINNSKARQGSFNTWKDAQRRRFHDQK